MYNARLNNYILKKKLRQMLDISRMQKIHTKYHCSHILCHLLSAAVAIDAVQVEMNTWFNQELNLALANLLGHINSSLCLR